MAAERERERELLFYRPFRLIGVYRNGHVLRLTVREPAVFGGEVRLSIDEARELRALLDRQIARAEAHALGRRGG